jgi:hypothetical protein
MCQSLDRVLFSANWGTVFTHCALQKDAPLNSARLNRRAFIVYRLHSLPVLTAIASPAYISSVRLRISFKFSVTVRSSVYKCRIILRTFSLCSIVDESRRALSNGVSRPINQCLCEIFHWLCFSDMYSQCSVLFNNIVGHIESA